MSAANNITTVTSFFIVYNWDSAPFRDERIPLFIKSIKVNQSLQPKPALCYRLALFHSSGIFQALYLFAIFYFCDCLIFSHILQPLLMLFSNFL